MMIMKEPWILAVGASAAQAGDSKDRSHRAGGARGAFANSHLVCLFLLMFDFCFFVDCYFSIYTRLIPKR